MSRNLQRITLTLPDAMAAKLRAESKRDDRPMSAIARKAFREYLGESSSSATDNQKLP